MSSRNSNRQGLADLWSSLSFLVACGYKDLSFESAQEAREFEAVMSASVVRIDDPNEGGTFDVIKESDTDEDGGIHAGTVIKPLSVGVNSGRLVRRINDARVYSSWFGVVGDGSDETEKVKRFMLASEGREAVINAKMPVGIAEPIVVWGNGSISCVNRWLSGLLWISANKPVVAVRDGSVNAMLVTSFFGSSGSSTLGGQKVSGVGFFVKSDAAVDVGIYVDSPTTIIDGNYLNGSVRRFDVAAVQYSKKTTFNSKFTNNVVRGMSGEGNYEDGDFDNLLNQTPAGVLVGGCQSLVIDKNTIQNCKKLIDMTQQGLQTSPVVRVVNNHLEQGYNTNDSENRAIDVTNCIQLTVTGNELFFGPHNDAGNGNPSPHVGIEVNPSRDVPAICRNFVITGNTFRIVTSATYDPIGEGPYFIQVKGDKNNLIGGYIGENTFIGREYPIDIKGTPRVKLGQNFMDFTRGGLVTYSDVDADTGLRPLPENEVSPHVAHGDFFTTNNSEKTVITTFEGGYEGMACQVRVNDNNTSIRVSQSGVLRCAGKQFYKSAGESLAGTVKLPINSLINIRCHDRTGGVCYVEIPDVSAVSLYSTWFQDGLLVGNYKVWIYNEELYMKDISGGLPSGPTDGVKV